MPAVSLADLSLNVDAALSLPETLRRQVARFLLRWRNADALALLPPADRTPREHFDRCRALVLAERLEEARDLARELVNNPEAGPWGQRAVGEVFLAMDKPHRADERFRAGSDPVGRARAMLLLGQPESALELLRGLGSGDPEVERVRHEALTAAGHSAREEAEILEALRQDELRELSELLEVTVPLFGADTTPEMLNTEEGLTQALERVFGYGKFRPGQMEVILPLMRGESVLGLMPTGAGKSLCYQLPAALLPGATVVISPLIALMKDQVEGLPPRLFHRATLINSSLEPGEADRRLEAVVRGEYSLIYAAPERLRQRSFVRALQRRGVSLFVIDEAHCVSLWGHDFRPDYFFIREVLRELGDVTVLALTATATPEMQDDIGRQLGVPLKRVNLGTYRPNLSFTVRRCGSDTEKWTAIQELLRKERGPAIIYVDRRKKAEELAAQLEEAGIPAAAYHAGLERTARDAAQTRFMMGEVRVIAATVAFGMGVDKADVRLVIHHSLPRCLEAYYQEAGRAGRDGLPAKCVLLYTSYDKSTLTNRMNRDRLQAAEILSMHRALSRMLGRSPGGVRADHLEQTCGTDPTRVRVGISLLQRLGALERGYDLPGSVWLAPTAAGNNGHRSPEFGRFAAAAGLGGRQAVTLSGPEAARMAAVPLEQLESTLLGWDEAGLVRFRSGGRVMGLSLAPNHTGLTEDVEQAVKQVQDQDTRRADLLRRFLDTGECRQAFVGRYFGVEARTGCGVCDNCTRTTGTGGAKREDVGRLQEVHSDEESAIFERLRAWRRETARAEGVPAYVIFHDRVLYAIARERPLTLEALSQVSGVKRNRFEMHGDEIVALVRDEH